MTCISQRQNKLVFVAVIFAIILSILFVSGPAEAKTLQAKRQISSRALRAMARVYMAYGEYDKAQPLAERALSYAKKNNAPDSELSACLIDLAWLYRYQGKLLQAQDFCREGLQLQQKALGPEHPYVAYTLRTQASIYQELAQYPLAAESLDNALTIMRLYHGPDDRVIAPFNVDIANFLVATGSLNQAEELYTHAFTLINEAYGPEHLYTAKVMLNFARLYTLQENYADAEQLIEKATPTFQQIYDGDNYAMAPIYLTKAKIFQAKQNYDQAEQLVHKAVTILQEKYKEPHPATAKALSSLAQLYFDAGKTDHAYKTCKHALEMFQNTLGSDNDHTAGAELAMAKIQIRLGKFEQAKTLCQNALKTYESIFDQNHPKLEPAMKTLFMLYQQTENYTEAAEVAQRILNIQKPEQIALAPVAKVLKQTNIAEKEIEHDF